MPGAYYNEIDPYCAQWLRNLIAAGHIAAGEVDERSIEDVRPDDLRGFTQCHFFAGIGVWSRALRLAGWPDDRPVWTGSCPCQPFSAAGKGAGFADERHLWPAWDWLISERRPPVIVGEQVASKDIDPWIDLVQADLEAMGYAVGCVPFPSAGVGAPHIRDRMYWMANAVRAGSLPRAHARVHSGEKSAGARHGELERQSSTSSVADSDDAGLERRSGVQKRSDKFSVGARGVVGGLADANGWEQQGVAVIRGIERDGENAGWQEGRGDSESRSEVCRMADATNIGLNRGRSSETRDGRDAARLESERLCDAGDGPGPANGFWRGADWIGCTDGKFRPVEPGTFPLADGAPARVGRLRAYGNAINPEAAAEFIRAADEALTQSQERRP